MSDVITDKSRFKSGWQGGLPETPCGYGSTLEATKAQRKWIPQIVQKYGIKTIADIGAGDLNWIKRIKLDAEVRHFDIVPRAENVEVLDITEQIPPKADMVLCLWVLNHLNKDDCLKALNNIKASGAKYLMMTDRPRYHKDQPPEILMQHIEKLVLNDVGDGILLCPI